MKPCAHEYCPESACRFAEPVGSIDDYSAHTTKLFGSQRMMLLDALREKEWGDVEVTCVMMQYELDKIRAYAAGKGKV